MDKIIQAAGELDLTPKSPSVKPKSKPVAPGMPKIVPTPGNPVEEFYDSSIGQMSLDQDDFQDPALVEKEEVFTESLSDMMQRDEKISGELAALKSVGFDISTPEKIEALRPLMWKSLESFEDLSPESYSTMADAIRPLAAPSRPVEPSVPEPAPPPPPAAPLPPVKPSPVTSVNPKASMPSYDDMVQMAVSLVSDINNPNKGKFWVERQISKQRILLNQSGLDGDAFETQVRGLMSALSNPTNDE